MQTERIKKLLDKYKSSTTSHFLKNIAEQSLTRHKKQYNLDMEYLNDNKIKIRSLRKTFLNKQAPAQVPALSSVNPEVAPQNSASLLFRTFIVHKHSNHQSAIPTPKNPIKINQTKIKISHTHVSPKPNISLKKQKKLTTIRLLSKSLLEDQTLELSIAPVTILRQNLVSHASPIPKGSTSPVIKSEENSLIKPKVVNQFPSISSANQARNFIKERNLSVFRGWDKFNSSDSFWYP